MANQRGSAAKSALSTQVMPQQEQNEAEYFEELELLFDKFGVRRFADVGESSSFGGYACVVGSLVFCAAFLYASILSKWLVPYTGYAFLDAIKDDHYFCYLFPLMIIPTVLVIYLNWLAMRYFESN